MSGRPLYHYTCRHGRAALGRAGLVRPPYQHAPYVVEKLPDGAWMLAELAWFTDLDAPIRAALGLTQYETGCDRTEHRYRVTDPTGVQRWVASRWSRETFGRALEARPGCLPMHWWIATTPVPVVLDERG